jgi:hypothetical protein
VALGAGDREDVAAVAGRKVAGGLRTERLHRDQRKDETTDETI